MNIPQWFLWLMSACAGIITVGGIPWASWVTYTLIVIQQRTQIVELNSERIGIVERTLESHNAQFQIIAATRFTAEQGRSMQTSIDRLEMKLDTMTRDVSDLRSRPPSRPPALSPTSAGAGP